MYINQEIVRLLTESETFRKLTNTMEMLRLRSSRHRWSGELRSAQLLIFLSKNHSEEEVVERCGLRLINFEAGC